MKKLLVLLLSVLMIASMMAGCGNVTVSTGDGAQVEEAEAENDADAETETDGDRVFKIAHVRNNEAWGIDFLKEGVMGDLEKEAGITIDWQIFYLSDFAEQKALLFAGGDLPDAIFGSSGFTEADLSANKDSFWELTPYINEDVMPNLTKILAENPDMLAAITDRNGEIYSLPKKLCFRPKVQYDMFINREWLDRLGLEMPTNYDELKEVLVAFKEQDANGNGDPNDEIPLSHYNDSDGFTLNFSLYTGFDVVQRGDYYMSIDANDQVVFCPMTDGYKEALKYMNELSDLGLLDEEYFTQDSTMYVAKMQQETPIVGLFCAWVADAWCGSAEIASQYELVPALEGPNGVKNAISMTGTDISNREFIITKACDDPEALCRYADLFYDDIVTVQNFYGSIKTGQIKDNGDGTYEVLVPENGTLDTSAWENSPRDWGPKYMNPEFAEKVTLPTNVGDGVKLAADAINGQYVDNPNLMHCPPANMKFTDEESSECVSLITDIKPYIESQFAQFTLYGGIDEGWDAYIQTLKDMGVDRLIEINQGAYDFYKSAGN